MRQNIESDSANLLKRLLVVVLAAVWNGADAANTVTYDMNGSGGWGDTTRWVGRTVPVEGDTVVIPAGRVVVNDSDYSVYSKVKINMTSGESVLSIAMEEEAHRNPFPLWQHLSGTGTVEKACAQRWVLGKYIKGYDGDWDIKRGCVTHGDAGQYLLHYMGTSSKTTMPPGRIFIRSGAYFDTCQFSMNHTFCFGYKEIHIAGRNATGSQDGIGAVHIGSWGQSTTNALSCVVLDDDAYITATGGGCTMGIIGLNPDLPGYLDLNGHDLYLTEVPGRPFTLRLRNILVTNSVPATGGSIYVGGSSIGNRHVLRVDKDVIFDENVKIVPTNYGQVVWNNTDDEAPVPVHAQLIAGGSTTNLVVAHDMTPDQTNRTDWAGAVEIGSGVTFRINGLGATSCRALVSGPISGSGAIEIGPNDCGQMILGGDNSSFTGKININGREGFGSLMALKPESIPVPGNVTVNGSTLVVPMENWTFQQYLNLANNVTYSNYVSATKSCLSSTTMLLDSVPGGSINLAVGDGQIADYANVALGVAGTGVVNVTSLPSEGRLRLAGYGGTVLFSGNTPYRPGSMLATSFADGANPAKFIFNGASDVDIGNEALLIGGPEGIGPSTSAGEIRVTDSLIYNHGGDDMAYCEGFCVGMNGIGRLVVENSCVTGRLQMAGAPSAGGATILKGGRFVSWGKQGAQNITNATMIAQSGQGYLEIDGCDFATRGSCYVSYYGGSGAIVQKSGSFNVGVTTGSPFALLYVGTHKGGSNPLRAIGQYWMKGGTGWSSHQVYISGGGNGGTYDHNTLGVMTIEGAGTRFVLEGQSVNIAKSPDSCGILNLNKGGEIRCKNIVGSGASSRRGVSFVNFDGGTARFTGWGEPYLFGKTGMTGDQTSPISHVTAYKGGGEVLLTSSDTRLCMGRPVCAPTGNGVVSVPWSDTSEYPVCPTVAIEGDGSGASAMVDYDSATRTVKGIVVTSPGCDYTVAKAYVRVGDQTNLFAIACNLEANDQTGGMTFRQTDTGKLRFDEVNTYRGQTTLMSSYVSAEFIVSNKDAFASSSAIALKGGTLNVADFTLDELTAPFKFMGGRIAGSSASYTVPEGKMVIDCDDIVAGETYTVANNANIVLPDTITVLNADKIEDRAEYSLLTLPAGYSGKAPAFAGIPAVRQVKRYGDVYKLRYRYGTQVVFR